MKWNSAKDLMTADVQTVDASWPIDRVAQFLTDHGISGAPVVKDDQLVGVVSLTDIARYNGTAGEPASDRPASFYRSELETEYAEEDLENLQISDGGETTVEHVMTPQVYDVSEHTSIQQVAQVMHRGGIHRVFVTTKGEVRGVITALDMLEVVAEM
ncbi:CBS domain-containing protein [Salinibacter altiplanensis]|uniref:CBS domain-containing protein n=1 Tax=Salinibacter altiplanensis TaxID=1803181 RepID=UPI000C9ED036|nr:CBS domain-containing protein [Salinibacter altiplanensis]